MYTVTIDFGDDTLPTPRRFENLTDLALYLERVPSMMGFEIKGHATVKIETVSSRSNMPQLPFQDYILRK